MQQLSMENAQDYSLNFIPVGHRWYWFQSSNTTKSITIATWQVQRIDCLGNSGLETRQGSRQRAEASIYWPWEILLCGPSPFQLSCGNLPSSPRLLGTIVSDLRSVPVLWDGRTGTLRTAHGWIHVTVSNWHSSRDLKAFSSYTVSQVPFPNEERAR